MGLQMKCFKCGEDITEIMAEEGYSSVYRCTCGALNIENDFT